MSRPLGPPQGVERDVRRRTALPTAALRPTAAVVDTSEAKLTSDEHLDRVAEQLHERVDADVETLAKGMLELIQLAEIGDKAPVKIAQEAFQAEMRAETMIRAAESLLALSHTLKLAFLLDASQPAGDAARDGLRQELSADADRKRAVAALQAMLEPEASSAA